MTAENVLIGIVLILALGIGSQWLAWRLRLPSILLLLLGGFLAGPVTGFLEPGELLGDLLLPIVSLSVSIILFEGGLSLKLTELTEIGKDVRNLIAIGVVVTWILATAAAYFVIGFQFELALLLGAILVVTGPTVIVPLVRYLRPAGNLGSILKWEGILNDVVGATVAVLTFETLIEGPGGHSTTAAIGGILKTLIAGGASGVLFAGLLLALMRRYWIPDHLQSPMALTAAVVSFALAEQVQHESGLIATTIMGVILANQKKVSIKHIIEFKENLRVLLISSLFILLSARLELDALSHINLASVAFVAILIVVVRPASVLLSTLRSDLSLREKLFLSWMAPRGIVAAAVSSVFALSLAEQGFAGAEKLVPITFLTIVSTIAIYGLTGPFVARKLQVSDTNPQGILFLGAHDWARKLASLLQERGFPVLMLDNNWAHIRAARMAGLPTHRGDALLESTLDEIDLAGIGRLFALTGNDEANSLAVLHFAEIFGRENLYQLPPEGAGDDGGERGKPHHLRGRFLFGWDSTYENLEDRFDHGAVLKTTALTEEFGFDEFREHYSETGTPLFLISEDNDLKVITAEETPTPAVGQKVISLVDPVEAPAGLP